MGVPLRLWEPISSTKFQPWVQFPLPWPHLWLAPPLGPAQGPLKGVAPEAVGAPINFPSPALTAAPPTLAPLLTDCPTYSLSPVLAAAVSPTLAPPLAGSSTGPSPRAPEGLAPEAVGAPIHSQSPVYAALPSMLSPPLAGYATGPSPGAPDGGTPDSVGAPTHWCSPSCTHWYMSDLSRLKMPDQPGPPASAETIDQEKSDRDDPCFAQILE